MTPANARSSPIFPSDEEEEAQELERENRDEENRDENLEEESESDVEAAGDEVEESEEESSSEAGIPSFWPRDGDLQFPLETVKRLPVQVGKQIRGETKITDNNLYVAVGLLFIENNDHYDTYPLSQLRATSANKAKFNLLKKRLEKEERTAELRHLRKHLPDVAVEATSRKRSRTPDSNVANDTRQEGLFHNAEFPENKRSRTTSGLALTVVPSEVPHSYGQTQESGTITLSQYNAAVADIHERQAEVRHELKSEIKFLKDELARLKGTAPPDLEGLRGKLEQTTDALAQLSKQNSQLTEQNNKLTKEKAAVRANYASLKEKSGQEGAGDAALREKNAKLQTQLTQITDTEKRLEEAEKAKTDLMTKLTEAEATTATALEKAKQLAKVEEDGKQRSASLETRITTILKENESLKGKITMSAQLEAQMDGLKKQVAEAEREKQEMRAKLDEVDGLRKQIAAAETKMIISKQNMAILEKETDSLKKQVAGAEAETTISKQKIASLEKEAEGLRKQVADAATINQDKAVADLKRQLGDSTIEIGKRDARIVQLEQAASHFPILQAEITKIETARKELQKNYQVLKGENETIRKRNDQHVIEKNKLSTELTAAQKTTDRLRNERDNLQRGLEDASYLHHQTLGHYGRVLAEDLSRLVTETTDQNFNKHLEEARVRTVNEKKARDAQRARAVQIPRN